jgi:2-succinyl-5-enolpyruvyl-6-hydroxy-3-cyclohexene-1-carboxylate synthase
VASPDLVLRLGAPLTSKASVRWLDRAGEHWVVDRTAPGWIPSGASQVLRSTAKRSCPSPRHSTDRRPAVARGWPGQQLARAAIDGLLDDSREIFEGHVVTISCAAPG